MKYITALLFTAFLLGACSSEPAQPAETDSEAVEDGLKANTEEKTFEEFLSGSVTVNANVRVSGIAAETAEKGFLLAADENSSGSAIYIDDIRLGEREPVVPGTAVTVYGSYAGENKDGMPVVKGIFIDEQ